MNRRNFFSLFSAGVAGIALEQAIPLGRVWSFPKKIKIPKLSIEDMRDRYLQPAMSQFFDGVDSTLVGPQHLIRLI